MSRRERPPAADLLALDDQILAVLADEDVSLSTAQIAKRLGYSIADREIVWRRLGRLAQRGRVTKTRYLNGKAAYWSLPRVQNVDTGDRL